MLYVVGFQSSIFPSTQSSIPPNPQFHPILNAPSHLGKYLCTDRNLIDRFIELAEKHENATLDISGVVLPWKITEDVTRVGSDRITLGIDGSHPYPALAGYARTAIETVKSPDLPETDLDNLFWNSIARLLKLT